MMGFETIAGQFPELIAKMTAVGFAIGAFVTLVTTGLCSVLHTFFKIAGGR